MTAKQDLYILGAGNMARETYYICKDLGIDKKIKGFIISINKNKHENLNKLCGKNIIKIKDISEIPKNSMLICAIGSPKRIKWIEDLEKKGYKFESVVHPSVSLWDNVKIGQGCIISKGVVLTCDIRIGKHSIININSNINHDCLLDDFVTVGPGAHIGGNVHIGEGSWIGIGTTIIHNINIGKECFIAAGAVVVKDIPDGMLAMGVPAKSVRKVHSRDWERLI